MQMILMRLLFLQDTNMGLWSAVKNGYINLETVIDPCPFSNIYYLTETFVTCMSAAVEVPIVLGY